MSYCKLYPNGFPYWSFGVFTYNTYSAESIEVSHFEKKNQDFFPIYDFLYRMNFRKFSRIPNIYKTNLRVVLCGNVLALV